jgi:AcrR family transcriptional regulator
MKSLVIQEDLRVRRTHKLLWEALMAELSERKFGEITVRDICERAMVHRTTFYKHYEDKYALLEQGMRQMYDTLLAEVNSPAKTISADTITREFERLFEHVAQHKQFYTLMLSGDGIGRFQKLVKDYIAEETEAKINTQLWRHQSPSVPPAMYAQFLSGALIGTLTWWLDTHTTLTPQQIAHHFLSLHAPIFTNCPTYH